ncbi:hypothetical protein L2E82_42349 [Cichorium intybus]|uniref:Uncharacterized protein n=1 Tax=Cichorium intybus TaxID=13427 RepID=A0ACB8ZKY7_CICIN|nr:hypothetical protein L2E82_42349 [Cichorium intybus]
MWEFANEAFARVQSHVLKNINRRRAPSQGPEQIGLHEVGRLKDENQVLIPLWTKRNRTGEKRHYRPESIADHMYRMGLMALIASDTLLESTDTT